MPSLPPKLRQPEATRRKLVDATLNLMLRQGFAGTTVDQICAEAGLTKGSFFHHFKSKEEISHAAVDAWAAMGTELYSAAWKDPGLDPLEQLNRIFEIMIGFNRLDSPCLCMVGMMSQEMALRDPAMREACEGHLNAWTQMVTRMLAAAKEIHPPAVHFDPEQVAWLLNSLWQGSMLVGKTRQSPQMIINNIRQARHYVNALFGRNYRTPEEPSGPETNLETTTREPGPQAGSPNDPKPERKNMKTETTLASESTANPFTISRTFNAPRELLWKSLTEPARMQAWFSPKGFSARAAKLDLRPGGTYHYCLASPDGKEMWGKMVYREIAAPERLVYISSFSDAEGGLQRHPMSGSWPLELLSTFMLVEKDGRTTLTLTWLPLNAAPEEITTFNASHDGMKQGWTGTFDNLTEYLAGEISA